MKNHGRNLLGVVLTSLCLSGALSTSVSAASIPGLFNTGVDGAGNALVGGNGTTDTHYLVLSSTIVGVATGVDAVTYFNGAYAAESATSRWISHSASGFPGVGTTTFRTTFDLTGLDPNTAAINGLNGADNFGTIVLNGVATGISLNGSFGVMAAFSITSGFVAGLNTLDFVVGDAGPPLAFRIDGISGTADVAAVPLPASVAMLVPALFGLVAARRKPRAG